MKSNSNQIREYFEEQINLISQQLQMMDSNLTQLNNTLESLRAIKESENNELLLPISNGIFLKSNAKNINSLLVNVGSHVIVEKTIDNVQELIEKNISEVELNHAQLLEQYQSSINMLNEINK